MMDEEFIFEMTDDQEAAEGVVWAEEIGTCRGNFQGEAIGNLEGVEGESVQEGEGSVDEGNIDQVESLCRGKVDGGERPSRRIRRRRGRGGRKGSTQRWRGDLRVLLDGVRYQRLLASSPRLRHMAIMEYNRRNQVGGWIEYGRGQFRLVGVELGVNMVNFNGEGAAGRP